MKPTTEPTYQEALILFAISDDGTCKAELGLKLVDNMTVGDLSKRVERLVGKGLVRLAGLQQRRQAPPSRVVVLTDRGRAACEILRRRGVTGR